MMLLLKCKEKKKESVKYMDFMKQAKKYAKKQPKLYNFVINQTVPSIKRKLKTTKHHHHKMKKAINQLTKAKKVVNSSSNKTKFTHGEASSLMALLSSKHLRGKVMNKFGMKRFQSGMLFLFLALYNTSHRATQLLMRKTIGKAIKHYSSKM